MPDEHGIAITIENLVQGDGIDDQGADPVTGVVRDRGRGIAAQDRRHRVKARLGQHGQQMPLGVGAVGEAVEAQRQRPVRRPLLEVGEVDPVGGDAASAHGREPTARLTSLSA